jgi:hypothetical protein
MLEEPPWQVAVKVAVRTAGDTKAYRATAPLCRTSPVHIHALALETRQAASRSGVYYDSRRRMAAATATRRAPRRGRRRCSKAARSTSPRHKVQGTTLETPMLFKAPAHTEPVALDSGSGPLSAAHVHAGPLSCTYVA